MVTSNSLFQVFNCTKNDLSEMIDNSVEKQFSKHLQKINPGKPTEKYLTRFETAEMLSISLTTLNDWTRKGILHSYKLGNRTYYKLSLIEIKLNNSNIL